MIGELPQSARPMLFLVALLLVLYSRAGGSQQSIEQQDVIETGRFRVYVFNRVQSEETYRLEREGASLVLKAKPTSLHQTLPEMTPLLRETNLRMRLDLTPQRLEMVVPSSAKREISLAIEINGSVVSVREGKTNRNVIISDSVFPIAAPESMSLQMMMARYWVRHGKPSVVHTIPQGAVQFRYRGHDTVDIEGSPVELERYSVSGLVWGYESMWLDASHNLVAVVVPSGALSWWQGVRDGYEKSLPVLLARFAEDGIADWKETIRKMGTGKGPVLAILGATLIDGRGGAPIQDSAVIIRNGRIVAAAPRSTVTIPQDAAIVSASAKFLLPGLWDMHAHMSQAEWGPAYLAAGVTTVRDCGGEFKVLTALRDAARSNDGLAPQMLLAGYVEGKNPYYDWDWEAILPDQVPAAVRHYHDAGFQQIKIRDFVSLDVLKALAIEAHRVGMTVTGHVPVGISPVQAVAAGEDQISHARFAVYPLRTDWYADSVPPKADFESPTFKEAIKLYQRNATVFDPTLVHDELPGCSPGEFCEPGIAKAPPELAKTFAPQPPDPDAKEWRRAFEEEISVVGILHRAGLRIVAGSDTGVPGHSLHRELELYVKAGLTPMEALQSATVVPASVMHLDKDVGTIEPGKRADMILLDANPLEDISNIRTVSAVIANGRMYDSAALWQSVGFKP